jgi:hypothetical protein
MYVHLLQMFSWGIYGGRGVIQNWDQHTYISSAAPVNVDSGSGCENGPIIHTVTSRFVASIPGQMYTPSTGNEHMGMYTADLDKGVLVNSKVHELGNPKKKHTVSATSALLKSTCRSSFGVLTIWLTSPKVCHGPLTTRAKSHAKFEERTSHHRFTASNFFRSLVLMPLMTSFFFFLFRNEPNRSLETSWLSFAAYTTTGWL